MKTFSNCWEMLKLSSLIRRRNSETSREMDYAEIKALYNRVLRPINNV